VVLEVEGAGWLVEVDRSESEGKTEVSVICSVFFAQMKCSKPQGMEVF
jgi:hypothetical protein